LFAVNVKQFLLCCVMGARVWGDVVLRIRGTRDLVPTHRRGVELNGFFVSAKCSDDGRPGKFAISGTSGAASHPILGAGFQVALTGALGRSYSNRHRQQSARQRRPIALGSADRRALSADACTVRRKDHLRGHQRVLPSQPAAHLD